MTSKMRLGYGSEYQLLRFLGHHRHELESIIHERTRLKGNLEWLDYPKDNTNDSLDGEHVGISFLPENLRLQQAWQTYWPTRGSGGMLLDAVLWHNNEWVIVDAKAQLDQIGTSTGAVSPTSIEQIQSAMSQTQKRFGIVTENDWTQGYYQLANRLALVNFLLDNGMNASLLNIYFINGYEDKENGKNKLSVKDVAQWEKAIADEYSYLGINDAAKQYIHEIFVEC